MTQPDMTRSCLPVGARKRRRSAVVLLTTGTASVARQGMPVAWAPPRQPERSLRVSESDPDLKPESGANSNSQSDLESASSGQPEGTPASPPGPKSLPVGDSQRERAFTGGPRVRLDEAAQAGLDSEPPTRLAPLAPPVALAEQAQAYDPDSELLGQSASGGRHHPCSFCPYLAKSRWEVSAQSRLLAQVGFHNENLKLQVRLVTWRLAVAQIHWSPLPSFGVVTHYHSHFK